MKEKFTFKTRAGFFFLLILVISTLTGYSQETYEMTYKGGDPSVKGVATSSQIKGIVGTNFYFSRNTNNPSGNTFNPDPDDGMSAIVQITSDPANNTNYPSSMGVQGITAPSNPNPNGNDYGYGYNYTGDYYYQSLGGTASNYSSSASSIGTGIDPATNYALEFFFPWAALKNKASIGEYKMATVTLNFNKPVDNPILHINGLAGYIQPIGGETTGEKDTYLEWKLTTPSLSFTVLSGSSNFGIYNSPTLGAVLTHTGYNGRTSPHLYADLGEGSILINGTAISSLVFDVYMKSNTAGSNFTAPNDFTYYFNSWTPRMYDGVVNDPYYGTTWYFYWGIKTALTISFNSASILPIKYANELSAIKDKMGMLLNWTSATEINNKGFEVERSSDGRNWTALSFMGSKAVNGNSTQVLSYSFTDYSPLSGINYYRLKQEDLDGKFEYGRVISITNDNNTNNEIKLYPNPAQSSINIENVPIGGQIRIIGLDGKVYQSLVVSASPQIINVSSLQSGVYFAQTLQGNRVMRTVKFTKR